MTTDTKRQTLEVSEAWYETERILGIELRDPQGNELPVFEAGAHLSFFLPGDMIRQYSLAGDPRDRFAYTFGVQRELDGRGGSAWMHDNASVGAKLETSMPMNNFPLDLGADRYLLIAGGVGITPLLSMTQSLAHMGKDFQLYYCTREREHAAFRSRLDALSSKGTIDIICDGGDPSQGLQVKDLLAEREDGTELYCCGPSGLMSAVNDAASHWPAKTVHFEWFVPSDDPNVDLEEGSDEFLVVIASTGQEFRIGANETILQVLNTNGFEIDSVCQEGVCGTCIVDVLEGEIAHRDHILDDEDKAENSMMTTCCSRAISEKLVLDL